MANQEKSFEDLLKEAPAAPGAGTMSLVGTLARSSEPGEFVLTLQDGRTVTLEKTAVKGHMVLGTSVGQTIVRIDVDASKVPAGAFGRSATPDIFTPPTRDYTLEGRDVGKPIWEDKSPWTDKLPWADKQPWTDKQPWWDHPLVGVTPFAMATPHQVSPATLTALHPPGVPMGPPHTFPWNEPQTWPWLDNTGERDLKNPYLDTHSYIDTGATGRPPYPD